MKINPSCRSHSLPRHLAYALLLTTACAMVQAADLFDSPGPGYRAQAGFPVEVSTLVPTSPEGPRMAPQRSEALRIRSWPMDPRSIGAPFLPKPTLHSDPLLPTFERDNPFSRSIRLFDGAPH